MKNLFLVDGASGTGKSDLLRWVVDNNANDVCYVRKGTTRGRRPKEERDPSTLLDLDFLTIADFHAKRFEYTYRYGGAEYGFSRAALNQALLRFDNVFLIVRNTATIRRVAGDYTFLNAVPMFIYTDRAELVARLRASKANEEAIQFRIRRSDLALREYYLHPEEYREVVINNSSRDTFHATIDRIVAKHSAQPSIDPYLVAVMMSFNPNNHKLDDYYDAIETGAQSIAPNLRCRRVDKAPGSPRLAAEFRNLVARARCTVVDLTENKPNVYYELGVIQASGKACIITAEEGTQPAFYPREHKILFYRSARELRERIALELTAVLGELPILEA